MTQGQHHPRSPHTRIATDSLDPPLRQSIYSSTISTLARVYAPPSFLFDIDTQSSPRNISYRPPLRLSPLLSPSKISPPHYFSTPRQISYLKGPRPSSGLFFFRAHSPPKMLPQVVVAIIALLLTALATAIALWECVRHRKQVAAPEPYNRGSSGSKCCCGKIHSLG